MLDGMATVVPRRYPMRGIQDRRYGYIFNAWSNGRKIFKSEAQNGRSYAAMGEAAEYDPALRERIQRYRYRVKEEFYAGRQRPAANS